MTLLNTVLTIAGLILFSFPVILRTFINKNKYIGFVNGTVELICVQTAIAIVFQCVHVFTYPLILSANIIYAVLITSRAKVFMPEMRSSLQSLKFKDFDWVLLIVLMVSVLCLYQVNYKYTGEINDIRLNRYIVVKDFSYPYPYFADEWYAVGFIKQSIETRSLPFKNLSYPYKSFTNLEFVYHSLIAEVTLLLRLNPLRDYTKMMIGFNTLIILLIYIFLRFIDIENITAGISALTALFITNGAVLPGIWTLIPVTIGLIILLLSLFYFQQKNINMIFLVVFLALIFYPPLVVIFTPALFLVSLRAEVLKPDTHTCSRSNLLQIFFKYSLITIASVFLISTAFLFNHQGLKESFILVISKLFYHPFEKAIRHFAIWNILPWPIIILALFALFNFDKEREWLKLMALISLFYWCMYSIIQFRVIIEYERVVYIASILLVVLSGIGVHQIVSRYRVLKYFQWPVLLFILLVSFNYTSKEQWKKLTFYYYDLGNTYLPAAPANMYLTQDDLRVFHDIHGQVFLSLPWKGTVIGVATGNYPRCTKSGTINTNNNLYNDFMNANCHEKALIAARNHIRYSYVPLFSCPYFTEKDKGSEGLELYEFQP
jgi:hypothetical protein